LPPVTVFGQTSFRTAHIRLAALGLPAHLRAGSSPAPSSLARHSNVTATRFQENAMHWLVVILIGLVAGWLTGKIMKGSGYGFFMDIILGIVGSLVGGFIALKLFHFTANGLISELLVALVGAILVVFLFRLITGNRG
jgi:uncharacterized membrane protein YeaQ/YmgE (transglycosylase-associated protein family)